MWCMRGEQHPHSSCWLLCYSLGLPVPMGALSVPLWVCSACTELVSHLDKGDSRGLLCLQVSWYPRALDASPASLSVLGVR